MDNTDILLTLILITQIVRISQHSEGARKIAERFWWWRTKKFGG